MDTPKFNKSLINTGTSKYLHVSEETKYFKFDGFAWTVLCFQVHHDLSLTLELIFHNIITYMHENLQTNNCALGFLHKVSLNYQQHRNIKRKSTVHLFSGMCKCLYMEEIAFLLSVSNGDWENSSRHDISVLNLI